MREYVFVLAMALAPLATPASAQDDPSIHMVTYIEVVPATQSQVATLLRQLAKTSRHSTPTSRAHTTNNSVRRSPHT